MDITFATKEATRRMKAPSTDAWNELVRLGRNLVRSPRMVNWYTYRDESEQIVALHWLKLGRVQKNEEMDVRWVHRRSGHMPVGTGKHHRL